MEDLKTNKKKGERKKIKTKEEKTVKKETENLKLPVYDIEGNEVSFLKLEPEIFGQKFNSDLVHQIIVSQMANKRKPIAHTKDRGEVSGGGKKPWRQKGTGRARHGSIRSPLWRGGGITFGPRKERVFAKKIPLKMKRKALFMVLSEKAKNNFLILLDKLEIEKPKTRLLAQLIENWKLKIKNFKGGSVLIVLPKMDKNIILAARNLAKVQTIQAKDLNVLDLVSFKYLIMPQNSIKIIKETFLKK